jgi:hypothetical protein
MKNNGKSPFTRELMKLLLKVQACPLKDLAALQRLWAELEHLRLRFNRG